MQDVHPVNWIMKIMSQLRRCESSLNGIPSWDRGRVISREISMRDPQWRIIRGWHNRRSSAVD